MRPIEGLSIQWHPGKRYRTSQAEPEFQENHERLKADRLAREAALNAKGK
jgi:hypothetical protein